MEKVDVVFLKKRLAKKVENKNHNWRRKRQIQLKNSEDNNLFEDEFFPFDLTWFITLKCNIRCPYCFVDDRTNRFIDSSLDPLFVLEKCQKRGIFRLNLLGGEPFLEKEKIIIIANNCDKYNVVLRSISTNGLIYDQDIVDSLAKLKYPVIVQISVDAATDRTYQLMRNNNNFSLIIENIKKFVSSGLNIVVSFSITRINYQEIDDFIELAKSVGVKTVGFGGVSPIGRAKLSNIWELDQELIQQLQKKILSKKGEISIIMENEHVCSQNCTAGTAQMSMLPNGDLYPCNLMINFPEANVGSFFQEKLNKYKNEWFWKFISLNIPKKCKSCSHPPLCPFACKAISYQYTKFAPYHCKFNL